MDRQEEFLRSGQSPPTSVNSLQIALFSLKERCGKQQKRIEDLEHESVTLNDSRKELYAEIKKLHEANVKLREKNLSLNQELHGKNKENCDIKQRLEGDRARNADNVRQLERLQHEVLNRVAPKAKEEQEDELDEGDNIASINTEAETDRYDEGGDKVKAMLEKSSENMNNLKTTIIHQQAVLTNCLRALEQSKIVKDQQAELLLGAVSTLAANMSKGPHGKNGGNGTEVVDGRCCPMCEAVFSKMVSQDQFEAHVLEHFVLEESETLSNYDTVPDVYEQLGVPNIHMNQLAEG